MAAASLVIVEMFLTAIAVTLWTVLVGDVLFSLMLSVTPERPGRPRSGSAVATHFSSYVVRGASRRAGWEKHNRCGQKPAGSAILNQLPPRPCYYSVVTHISSYITAITTSTVL